MYSYIFKKTLNLILTLLVVISITFFILDSLPGTPLSYLGHSVSAQMRENFMTKHGLHLSSWERYRLFLKNIILHRNLGSSMIYPGRIVLDEIRRYGGVSFILGVQGMAIGLLLGIAGALASITVRSRPLRIFLEGVSLILVSAPNFIIASLMYYLLSVRFPSAGFISLGGKNTLPAVIVVALSITGIYMRYIREAILSELKKDYIFQARLKGCSGFSLLRRHVLKNALTPVIGLILPQLAGLFMGFYIIEGIFSVPGFGNIYIDSINNKDYNMILGATLVFTFFYVITVYLTDIFYAVMDPRIRRRKDEDR